MTIIHTMYSSKQNNDGTQKWSCPTCGRKIELTIDHKFSVLVVGDNSVNHTGSSGGITMGVTANVDDLNRLFKR